MTPVENKLSFYERLQPLFDLFKKSPRPDEFRGKHRQAGRDNQHGRTRQTNHGRTGLGLGGPIGLLRNGDRLRIDFPNRRMDILVPEAELEQRRQSWTPIRRDLNGWLARYQKLMAADSVAQQTLDTQRFPVGQARATVTAAAAALTLAAVAVCVMAVRLNHVPWIALGLALSFGFYGYVRKQTPVDSLDGLTIEIRNVRPVLDTGDLVIATYEEWQRWSGGSNARTSTVVFTIDSGARHGLRWKHVHETWLNVGGW